MISTFISGDRWISGIYDCLLCMAFFFQRAFPVYSPSHTFKAESHVLSTINALDSLEYMLWIYNGVVQKSLLRHQFRNSVYSTWIMSQVINLHYLSALVIPSQLCRLHFEAAVFDAVSIKRYYKVFPFPDCRVYVVWEVLFRLSIVCIPIVSLKLCKQLLRIRAVYTFSRQIEISLEVWLFKTWIFFRREKHHKHGIMSG